jgi:hypothetical protein
MSSFYYKDFDLNLSRIKRRNKHNEQIFAFSENENNIKTIDNNRNYNKINTKLNSINKIKNYNNKNININKTNIDKNNNLVSLSDLYTLPNYKTKSFNFFNKPKKNLVLIKNKKKQIRNNIYNLDKNFRFITSNDNVDIKQKKNNIINKIHIVSKSENKNKNVKTIDQFANLPNFMKDRFYSDVEEKLNYHFKNKPFYYDVSLKNKIIQLNQIKEFWGGMSDYTNPILCTKRVRYLSKLIEDRKNLREKKDENYKNKESEIYYKLVKKRNKKNNIEMPKLYTNSNFIEKRREEIRKNRIFRKEKKNKTEDNMIYFS